jgi:hypothetical protein
MVVSPDGDDVAREPAGPAAASVAPHDAPLASQVAAAPETAAGALVAPGLLERALAKTETPHATVGKGRGLRLGLLVGTLAVAAGVWVAQDRTLVESWMARVLPATTTDATPQPPANEASGTIRVVAPTVPTRRRARSRRAAATCHASRRRGEMGIIAITKKYTSEDPDKSSELFRRRGAGAAPRGPCRAIASPPTTPPAVSARTPIVP